MPDLTVQIKADLTNYIAGMKQAGVVTTGATDGITKSLNGATQAQNALIASQKQAERVFESTQVSITGLNEKLTLYKDLASNATDPTKLATYNRTIQETTSEVKRLSNVGKTGFDEFGNAVEKNTNYLTKGFSAVRQLAYVLPGIGIAGIIAFATEPIIAMVSKLDLLKDAFSITATTAKELNSALAGPEYSKAISRVSELTENISLAKASFLNKKEVLKEYNDTLGKTIGHADTLNKAEALLISKGPAFIQMTLLKASAQLALADAAKASYESAQLKAKRPDEFVSAGDILGGVFNSSTDLSKNIAASDKLRAEQKQRQDKAVKDKQDEANATLQIFRNYQSDAAKLATDNKMDFFGGKESEKPKVLKTQLQQLEAQYILLQDAEAKWIEAGNAADPFNLTPLQTKLLRIRGTIDDIKERTSKGLIAPQLPNESATGVHNINSTQGGLSLPTPNFDKAISDLAAYAAVMRTGHTQNTQFIIDTKEQAAALKEVTNILGGGLTNAFQQALSGTQTFAQAFGQFIVQLIERLIAAIAVAAILAALLTFTGLGAITGAATGVGAFAKNFTSSIHLADGGITTGPTHALIGEGREKEAVMPLSKLQSFVNTNNNGMQHGQIVGIMRGSDLILQYQRASIQKGRIG